jgi:hypothetical protein
MFKFLTIPMQKIACSLMSISLLLPVFAYAEEATTNKWFGATITGYIDGSYNYLQESNQFVSGNFDRVFDLQENGFTLQQAALTVAKQPSQGFGGLVNVILGRDALSTAAFGYDPDIGIENIGFDVLQIYLQYAQGPILVIAGKFVTLVGTEVIDPTANTNFSRGLLFAQTPDTHLGLRATYTLNDKLKFNLGFNDGWDNIRDFSRGVTTEWGIAYTPCAKIALSAQGYSGEERVISHTATGSKGWRNLIDLIATYNIDKHLTLAANYDYGNQKNVFVDNEEQENVFWQGLATYINYKFNDLWRFSVRTEIFEDPDGYRTGIAQTLKEITFTVGYAVIKNAELRAETRRDFSNVAAFLERDGSGASKTQQSYAVEAFYKF